MRMRSTFSFCECAPLFFLASYANAAACTYTCMYVCFILCMYALCIHIECVLLMYMKVHMYTLHPNVWCTSDVYEGIYVYYTSQCMEGRGTSHTSYHIYVYMPYVFASVYVWCIRKVSDSYEGIYVYIPMYVGGQWHVSDKTIGYLSDRTLFPCLMYIKVYMYICMVGRGIYRTRQ